MDRSERNSRLVLLIGMLGVSGYLLKIFSNMLTSSFTRILNSKVPISSHQVFSSLLISGFFIILMVAVLYILLELNSFRNLEFENKIIGISSLADLMYKCLMRMIILVIFWTILLTTLVANIPQSLVLISDFTEYLTQNKLLWFLISLLIVIVGVVLFRFVSYKSENTSNVKKEFYRKEQDRLLYIFINRYGLNSKDFQIGLIVIFCFIWIFIIWPTALIVGINQNINTEFSIDYKRDSVTLKFNSKTADYLPEGVYISNILSNSCTYKYVSIEDFTLFVTRVNSMESNGQTYNKIGKSVFDFEFVLDTAEMAIREETSGYTKIGFSYEKFSSKDTVEISNYFEIKNNKFEFQKDEFEIKL